MFSEMTKNDTSLPAGLLQIHPAREIQTLSTADVHPHRQAPGQPLEFDPGGRDELNEGLLRGVESSAPMRVSGCASHGVQVQLNTNTSEVRSTLELMFYFNLIKSV